MVTIESQSLKPLWSMAFRVSDCRWPMLDLSYGRSSGQRVRRVDDLGPDALLTALREVDLVEREAARDKLVIAYQWCILHPATTDTGVAQWGDPHLPGALEADESLGGEGTPAVAAFTPEPFAAALGSRR